MASMWEIANSIFAGNLNSGSSYLITAVTDKLKHHPIFIGVIIQTTKLFQSKLIVLCFGYEKLISF